MRQTAPYPDLYEVLGAPPGADPEELQEAYRSRTRDTADDPEAEQRLRELSDAYAVLSKPRSRLLYDRVVRGLSEDSVAPVEEVVGTPAGDEIEETAKQLLLRLRERRELEAADDARLPGLQHALAEVRTRIRARTRDTVDDPEAEQRLRELSDAYAVLSKPRSRLLYDRVVRGLSEDSVAPVEEVVGTPAGDEIEERQPIELISGDEPAVPPVREPRDQRLVRYMAAAALVVSIVFLVAVLLA